MSELDISALQSDRLKEAASLTSRAFQDSPAYREIVPDAERRQAFLPWLFERNLWLMLGSDCTRCVFEEKELVMFFMLEMPSTPLLTTWDMVRAGLLRGYITHGVGAMQRLVETKAWYEARERQVLGERAGTVARLERVTVLPSRQGQGIGTRALTAALKETDELGVPVFLCTQEERNVTFYRRLGFEVVADEICPIGRSFRNWMMLREPRS